MTLYKADEMNVCRVTVPSGLGMYAFVDQVVRGCP